MLALKQLDPDGSVNRSTRKLKCRQYQNQGPNFCWHLDGYDKLKPFGFPIHGCIDGYSRNIIWMKTIHSNNDPFIVGAIFLDNVKDAEGCPSRVRSNCGIENVVLAAIQPYICRSHQDQSSGLNYHIYGTSCGNQRIECWWSHYRRYRSTDIKIFFKGLIDNDIYNPADPLHLQAARFCFGGLLHKDLYSVVECWNTHRIRPSGRDTITGIPDELYFLPEKTGGQNMLQAVNQDDIDEIEEFLEDCINNDMTDTDCFTDHCEYIRRFEKLGFPKDRNTAKSLFSTIIFHAQTT